MEDFELVHEAVKSEKNLQDKSLEDLIWECNIWSWYDIVLDCRAEIGSLSVIEWVQDEEFWVDFGLG